jgi:DNA-binding XRE family transcriptional regulator
MKDLEFIQCLVDCGISKWKMAKYIGVSWNTVHAWHRGIYKIKKEYKDKLLELKKG